MNGKILGDGVIRGYDGRRYAFSANEIQNAQGKNINDLVGSEVDFEISNSGLAISIYITEFKSIKPQSNFLQNLSSPNLAPVSPEVQSIKTKAFIFMGICVIGAFIYGFSNALLESYSARGIGFFLAFVGIGVIFGAYMVLYSAMESMWKMAKSAILKECFCVYLLVVIVMNIAVFISRGMANGVADDAVVRGLFSLVAICCLIYSFILRYKIYKEVAYITNQPLFMYAFWLIVTIILSPIGVLLYIIAWIKVREIRESISAVGYDKLGQTSKNTTNNLKSLQITETQQTQINDIDFSKSNDKDTIQHIKSNTKNKNKHIVHLYIILTVVIVAVLLILYNIIKTQIIVSNVSQANIITHNISDSYKLGFMYYNGNGVNRDYKKAAGLWQKACEILYNATACNNLGFMYANGEGINKNYHKAIKLWENACYRGNANACSNLALMYYNGKGVQQSNREAKRLWHLSCYSGKVSACQQHCNLGNANICRYLGIVYYKGQ